jgi:hypothetical protein
MRQRQVVALMLLSGTVALTGWGATTFGAFDSRNSEAAAPIGDAVTRGAKASRLAIRSIDAAVHKTAASYLTLPQPDLALAVGRVTAAASEPVSPAPVMLAAVSPTDMPALERTVGSGPKPTADAVSDDSQPESTFELASAPSTHVPTAEDAASDPDAPRGPGKLVNLFRPQPVEEDLKPARPKVEIHHECPVIEICIDEYLWALYERTPKVDTNKVVERYKATVKRKGKTRTVTKTRTKYVLGDFTWKDPAAAKRVGMSLKDYVIGGMDRSFKLKLFRAVYAMEQAGLMPGITSAFRDDYRQAIAEGKKAASDSSFHGGSRRGGYGHGMAVDLVSVKGENRSQRWVSTVELWKWIDANEKTLGVGRPYLDRDPPHVVPIDGREFIAKRGGRSAVRTATLGGKKATKAAKVARAEKKSAPAAKPETKTAQAKPQASTPAAKPQTKTAQAAKPQPTTPPAAKQRTKTAQAPKPQAKTTPAVKPKAVQAAEPKKRRVGDGTEPATSTRAKPAKPKVSSLWDSLSFLR